MNEEQWLLWSCKLCAWWGPNQKGYTKHRNEAGRYSFEEAKQVMNECNKTWDFPGVTIFLEI